MGDKPKVSKKQVDAHEVRSKESSYYSSWQKPRMDGRMKKSLLTLVVLSALAGGASAQSSVVVYGVVDLYYSHDSGGSPAGSVNSLDSSSQSLSGSRLGFKGTEDLGGGLAAIYTAEMGFSADTGAFDATGTGFGRQAFVGLKGNFGTVKLGRQYNPLFSGGYQYDPFGGALEGFYNRVISLGAGKRFNNTILYDTPDSLSGFSAQTSYSLGEVPGDNSQGRVLALTAGYANGPFATNFIYNNYNNVPAAGAAIVNTKNTGIGASYDFKVAKISGLYQINKSDAATALDTRDYLIGASAPIGAGTVMASYISHKNKALANADTKQIAIGYKYLFSKRTTLYTSFARIANDAEANIATPGTSGGTDKAFNAGINHSF